MVPPGMVWAMAREAKMGDAKMGEAKMGEAKPRSPRERRVSTGESLL